MMTNILHAFSFIVIALPIPTLVLTLVLGIVAGLVSRDVLTGVIVSITTTLVIFTIAVIGVVVT
jgi:hypothetical protein